MTSENVEGAVRRKNGKIFGKYEISVAIVAFEMRIYSQILSLINSVVRRCRGTRGAEALERSANVLTLAIKLVEAIVGTIEILSN